MDKTFPATPDWTVTPQPGNQINSTAISGDGTRMLLGTSNEFDSGHFCVFCYNGQGRLLWQHNVSPAPEPIYQGVFWVAISRDGRYAAAGGERSKDDSGFLYAYEVETGNLLLSADLGSRVNQVSLSEQGEFLLAVFGSQAELYSLNSGSYVLADTYSVDKGAYINSAMISNDGNRAVLSVIRYNSETSGQDGSRTSESTGSVVALNISRGKFSLQNKTELPFGSMRASIIDSGQWWGASLHDGSCAVFNDFSEKQPVWHYRPEENTGVAYAFSISETNRNELIVACGANVYDSQHGGCVYVLKSGVQGGTIEPELLWTAFTEFGVNPGVNLDLDAYYVTATDGVPTGDGESAGNFYLFDRKTGQKLWTVPTSKMNWPMVIASGGNSIFGASDNGTAYYWSDTCEPIATDSL